MTSDKPYAHTVANEIFSQLKMAPSLMVKSSFYPQKGRRSSTLYMEDIWASTSVSTKPDTVCIGPVLMWTLDELLNCVPLANITSHRNHDSHSSQLQLQSAHSNTLAVTISTSMVQSTQSSLITTPRCQ